MRKTAESLDECIHYLNDFYNLFHLQVQDLESGNFAGNKILKFSYWLYSPRKLNLLPK